MPNAPDRYAVIGNPIAQSKSPTIHMAFAQQTGQQMVYDKVLAPLDGFAAALDAFRAAGGLGMNVTAPFKLDACAYATDLAPSAQMVGAANALKFVGDRVHAENFDGIGLLRDVQDNLHCPLPGKRVLVLGAGGATRGALLPLLQAKLAQLVIANRSADKAHDLRALMRGHEGAVDVHTMGFEGLQMLSDGPFDVVLNATSASLSAQSLPLPAGIFASHTLAYDLTYGKGMTPFLQQAQAAGVQRLHDGVGMLVEQAAEAFLWWRGVRPATQSVIAQITVPLS
jgi:shikimate dehydrogenase